MLDYIRRHWQGQQSLGWSFWVNLVGIRVLVFMLQTAVAPTEDNDYQAYTTLVWTFVVAFHLLLLIWQLTGVLRSADRHYAENGNMALIWGAQLGGVLMFVLSAVYALGAVQMTLPAPDDVDRFGLMDKEHASQYQISLSEDGRLLNIVGSMELGITRSARRLLNAQSSVRAVVLDSDGGNIYEGRGLAKLFGQYGLSTHVNARCASACTIAYAGGSVRTASAQAVFGFHQYRFDADYTIVVTDVGKEQRRDQQLFLDAGVSRVFVEKVFTQPALSMWWPDLAELNKAGFVHRVRAE